MANRFVNHYATTATKDRSAVSPLGVNAQTNAPQFTMTVTQKITRKECFLDLWRNFC
jgi:hypothetical protein